MIKKTYQIKGMDCGACAKMIELDLEDMGVNASCNYETQTLTVNLPDDKSEKKVLQSVKKSGYEIVS